MRIRGSNRAACMRW